MKGFKEKLLTGTLAFTMVLTSAAVQFNTNSYGVMHLMGQLLIQTTGHMI